METKQKNKKAFVYSIIALSTSILFFLFIPVIFLILGWVSYKNVKKESRLATKVLLITAAIWLGIKVFVLLAYVWILLLTL